MVAPKFPLSIVEAFGFSIGAAGTSIGLFGGDLFLMFLAGVLAGLGAGRVVVWRADVHLYREWQKAGSP